MKTTHNRLKIATAGFAETYDPLQNAAVICRQIRLSAAGGADIVHFHECALSGYLARADLNPPGWRKVDWRRVRQGIEEVCRQSADCGVWTILGSSHPLSGNRRPTNCLYLIGPDGAIRDRYDKRFCTKDDLRVYSPGDRTVKFEVKGVTCALLICFDLRFPELYRRLYKLGVRVVFQSFHNAYYKGPTVHRHIIRQTLQANAACNAMWISATNSTGVHSSWGGVFITPDGVIAAKLKPNRPGVMVNSIDLKKEYYDPMKPFRASVLAGKLHTGKIVRDDRLADPRRL